MSLNVTIPDTFNGPLDLLLHLIRRDEMDIYDIPIAKLTASYLEEMRKLEMVDVDEGAEFLDLASRLLEIKSRMLMPPEERLDEEGEEDEDFDPRTGLVEALLEYRRFKDAAKLLGEMADEQSRRIPRIAPRLEFQLLDPDSDSADSMDLFAAFQGMLVRMMPQGDSNVITYTEVPTSVRIEQISTVLREIGKTRFSLLLSGTPSRQEMVGFFIALLEMIRQGLVVARQTDNFSDIILERQEPAERAREGGRQGQVASRRMGTCFPSASAGFPTPAHKQVRTGRVPSTFPSAAPARVPSAPRSPSLRATPPLFPVPGR